MTATLYWLDQSRAGGIVWLLEYVKADYEITPFFRGERRRAPADEVKKINPFGISKLPVFEDSEKKLAESIVIARYIARKYNHPELLGVTEDDKDKVEFFTQFAESTLGSAALVTGAVDVMRKAKKPMLVRPVANQIADEMDRGFNIPETTADIEVLAAQLKANGTGYFVGDGLTIVDFLAFFQIENAARFVELPDAIKEWKAKMQETESYKAAVAKEESLKP